MITNKIAVELSKNFIGDLKQLGYFPQEAYLFNSYSDEDKTKNKNINLVLWGDNFSMRNNEWNEFKYLLMDDTYLIIHTYNSTKTEEEDSLAKRIRINGWKIL